MSKNTNYPFKGFWYTVMKNTGISLLELTPCVGQVVSVLSNSISEEQIKNRLDEVTNQIDGLFKAHQISESQINDLTTEISNMDQNRKNEMFDILNKISSEIPNAVTPQRMNYLATAIFNSCEPKNFNYSLYTVLLSSLLSTPDVALVFLGRFKKELKKNGGINYMLDINAVNKIDLSDIDKNHSLLSETILSICENSGLIFRKQFTDPNDVSRTDFYYKFSITNLGNDLLAYIEDDA